MSRPHLLRRACALIACVSVALGCRTSERPVGTARTQERTATATPSNPGPTSAASSSAAPAVSAGALLRAMALPELQPIAKGPFPEGVDQATLCAALDSKEPDLWLRFGHFIPLFERGVLYVLNTGAELNEKLRNYMAREYKPGWNAMLGSCGERTLVYIRVMYGDGEYDGKPFGRMHLAQQLEKKFGLKVLENIQIGEDDRFPRYCRADAELCDAILKLHVGNKGLGLCSHAIIPCLDDHRGTEAELQAACKKTPPAVLACSKYRGTRAESLECTARIQAALCPGFATSP